MKTTILLLLLAAGAAVTASAQEAQRDKGIFASPKNEFMDSVRRASDQFKRKPAKSDMRFMVDFSTISHPASPGEFTSVWHNPPISQGISGMCWCFSATSYFESEIYRLTKRTIKLSELYTVYWEYVEKARRFVRERGNSAFGEGSEGNAVMRIWQKYGAVPADAYTGLQKGQVFHDHSQLIGEMSAYLNNLKVTNNWNEEEVIGTIKSILNHYIGEPPSDITVGGKAMTPKEYFNNIVRLNPDDYICFMSLMDKPYHAFGEYEVGDNWWHSAAYYNIPLDEYMKVVKTSIRNGYSVCLGGDVSEAGYEGHAGIGVVPTFDIPANYIDESARQLRFSNGTSGDDHGIHLVGYSQKDGVGWYLIKDSGSGSRNNSHPGYYFYREDYIKLKMLDVMVHKDAVKDFLKIAGKAE